MTIFYKNVGSRLFSVEPCCVFVYALICLCPFPLWSKNFLEVNSMLEVTIRTSPNLEPNFKTDLFLVFEIDLVSLTDQNWH